jgi:CBS domain-containing protein
MKLETVLATKGSRVFTASPATTIRQAMTELAANNIGALIVLGEDGQPVGILSERDLIRELSKDDGVLGGVVADYMTSPIVTGLVSDDAEAVLRTMTVKRFRHLPVVEDGKLVGMVTLGDLVKAQLAAAKGTVETLEVQLLQS